MAELSEEERLNAEWAALAEEEGEDTIIYELDDGSQIPSFYVLVEELWYGRFYLSAYDYLSVVYEDYESGILSNSRIEYDEPIIGYRRFDSDILNSLFYYGWKNKDKHQHLSTKFEFVIYDLDTNHLCWYGGRNVYSRLIYATLKGFFHPYRVIYGNSLTKERSDEYRKWVIDTYGERINSD